MLTIYTRASMKSYQNQNFDILENIQYSSTADWFGEKNQFHEPWNYGARDVRAVCVYRSFETLIASFS